MNVKQFEEELHEIIAKLFLLLIVVIVVSKVINYDNSSLYQILIFIIFIAIILTILLGSVSNMNCSIKKKKECLLMELYKYEKQKMELNIQNNETNEKEIIEEIQSQIKEIDNYIKITKNKIKILNSINEKYIK